MYVKQIRIFCLAVSAMLLLTRCSDKPDNAQLPGDNEPRVTPPGLVAPDAQWESVADGLVYADSAVTDADGNVYFAEVYFNRIYKVDPTGALSFFDEATAMTQGLVLGPEGMIYGCRNLDGQIVRYNAAGDIEVILQGKAVPVPDGPDQPPEFCNDLVFGKEGGIWFTDRINQRVMYLSPNGDLRAVAEGFRPNGIVLSLDKKLLVVTDSYEPVLHAFSVGNDGALTPVDGFFPALRLPKVRPNGVRIGDGRPGTNGLAVDSDGRFYVSTFYGIQVFDRDGRYLGVIDSPPGLAFVSSVSFGGPDKQWLYGTGRNGIFRLKMQVQGIGR